MIAGVRSARDGALGVAESLMDGWRVRGWHTADPYDGLNARWIGDASRLPRPLRLGLVQLHKRSPVNLRPLLGVRASRSAYAEGLFASAGILLWRQGRGERHLEGAREATAWLEANRIRGGWAYPFPVQTRTHFYPPTSPNVVATAFAANAFLDLAEATGERGAVQAAVSAARFAVAELLRDPDGPGPWFAYLPGDAALIHNANLLAARLCVRAGSLAGDEKLVAVGRHAVGTTLAYQRPDGSFLYGVGKGLDWIDGHHTGFVVECLSDLLPGVPEASGPLARASAYYRRVLFRPDGAPRPGPGRDVPVDTIAGAQGILALAKLGELDDALRIARWMLSHMRTARGTFAYQRGRLHRKAVPYARWSDAPMALALATLAERSGSPA